MAGIMVLSFSAALSAAELVSGGKGKASILLSADAGAAEKHAASELSAYVRKITGAALPVGARKDENATVEFILFNSPAAKSLPPNIQEKASKIIDDGFVIASDPSGIKIISHFQRGLLYGAYQLLKDAGVIWFMPGEENEYVPRNADFKVADGVRLFNPAFPQRRFILNGGSGYTPDTYDWIVRNGSQLYISQLDSKYAKWAPIYIGGGHAMTDLLVGNYPKSEQRLAAAEKLFAEHPEYFGLYKGQRIMGGNPTRSSRRIFCQPCTSNPGVLARILKNTQEIISRYEGKDYNRILCNDDHMNWCECASCKALDGKAPADENGRYSNRWWHFVNFMAQNLLSKDHPNLKLYSMVYQNFRLVPENIKPDPRVAVIICPHQRCYIHSINDPACFPNSAKYRKMFDSWHAAGVRSTTFEYHTNLPGNSYLPMEEAWVRDLKYYHSIHMEGFGLVTRAPDGKTYIERRKYLGKNMWPALWQLHWLTGYFSWNIDADYDKVAEEINSKFYGSAWKHMKNYRRALREAVDLSKEHMYYGSPHIVLGICMDRPGLVNHLESLLASAEKAAESPLILSRIQREKGYFEKNWKTQYQNYLKDKDNRITAQKRKEKIVIDGLDREADWKNAKQVYNFTASSGTHAARLMSIARVCFDEENLYFFLEGQKAKNGKMVLEASVNSKKIFSDSHFEIFLNCPAMKREDYQLAVNAKGMKYQTLGATAAARNEVDLKPEIAVKDHPDRWCAEIRIPVKDFTPKIATGDFWNVNIARVALLEDNKLEFSSWCNGIFHGNTLFRRVMMGIQEPLLKNPDFEVVCAPEQPKKKGKKNTWTFVNDESVANWIFSNANPGTLTVKTDTPASGKVYLHVSTGEKYSFIDQYIRIPKKNKNTGIYTFRMMVRGKAELLVRLRGPKTKYYGNIAVKVDSADKWLPVTGIVHCDEQVQLALSIRIKGELDIDDVHLSMADSEEMPDSSKH